MSKALDFFRLITGKTLTKITLTCQWHAASRYARRSDIKTEQRPGQ